MSAPLYRALVLAGSRHIGDPVAIAGGVSRKAFVAIGGRTMIEHVIHAIRDSGRIRHIVISCEAEIDVAQEAPKLAPLIAEGFISISPSARGPSVSTMQALEETPADEHLFVTTADHPLLTGAIIRGFLEGFERAGVDIGVGLAPLDLVQATYPKNRRTALRFKGGAYSGCNLFAFKGGAAMPGIALWRQIEADRKRPLRMAARIGVGILARYLFGRLTLEDAFRITAGRIGVSARPVIIENADAATDVDSLEDLALVRKVMTDA